MKKENKPKYSHRYTVQSNYNFNSIMSNQVQ